MVPPEPKRKRTESPPQDEGPDELWGDRYFETQAPGLAQCGKHALNNIFGGEQFLASDMDTACARVIAQTDESTAAHKRDHGWYSHSVLAEACRMVIGNEVRMEFRPLPLHPATLFDARCRGAIVNIRNVHWTALVKHAGAVWYVDSLQRPQRLQEGGVEELLQRWPETYAIVSEEFALPART